MKKYLFIFIFLLFISNVYASEFTNLYISKKDFETKEYIADCDFLLYDSDDNIVDAWVASDDTHEISNIKKGSYKLVERPFVDDSYSDELSIFHSLDVNTDEVMEVILYNSEIDTPRNLSFFSNYIIIGTFIIFAGFIIVYLGHRKFYKTLAYNNTGEEL